MIIDMSNKLIVLEGHDYNGRDFDRKISFSDLMNAKYKDEFSSGRGNTCRESRYERLIIDSPSSDEYGTYRYHIIYCTVVVDGYTMNQDAEYFEYEYPIKIRF